MTGETIPRSSAGEPAPRTGYHGQTLTHTRTQLPRALGWSTDQWARAWAAGLVPPADRPSGTWSGPLVDSLIARRQELLDQLPDDADPDEMMRLLGVEYGAWRRGLDAGVIPGPDRGEYWTRPLADQIAARADQIRAAIPPQPLGARRCAELLTERTGIDVVDDDVEALAERGLTTEVGDYKGWALYDVAAVRQVADDADKRAVLEEIVAERQAWMAASLTPAEAAASLGWRERDLVRIARTRRIAAGRYGRYARTDIEALSRDKDLVDDVRRAQLLGPNQSADHMEIRRVDFDYVVDAGWVRPADWFTWEITRTRTVDVPLYRLGDLEDVLYELPRIIPGLDWDEVRAAQPGEPSPLRRYARKGA